MEYLAVHFLLPFSPFFLSFFLFQTWPKYMLPLCISLFLLAFRPCCPVLSSPLPCAGLESFFTISFLYFLLFTSFSFTYPYFILFSSSLLPHSGLVFCFVFLCLCVEDVEVVQRQRISQCIYVQNLQSPPAPCDTDAVREQYREWFSCEIL